MKRKIISWTLITLWCGVIFFMSSRNGSDSSAMSMFVVHVLDRIIAALFGSHAFSVPELLVRKTAHFTEYLMLGGLFLSGFFSAKALRRSIILALCSGVLYATSDELHQLFIPGRTSSPLDVGIDAVGVLAGIAIASTFLRWRYPKEKATP